MPTETAPVAAHFTLEPQIPEQTWQDPAGNAVLVGWKLTGPAGPGGLRSIVAVGPLGTFTLMEELLRQAKP